MTLLYLFHCPYHHHIVTTLFALRYAISPDDEFTRVGRLKYQTAINYTLAVASRRKYPLHRVEQRRRKRETLRGLMRRWGKIYRIENFERLAERYIGGAGNCIGKSESLGKPVKAQHV